MALASLRIDVTFDNFTLLLLAGALMGLITGQLMKSRGIRILGDLVFGVIGALAFVVLLVPLLGLGRFGFTGDLVLAFVGSIVFVVLEHGFLVARNKAKAA
ncbi:MAG: GlsB/YeaQ/YmgE family stress response membrane protein [Ktedonobacterales bacterium]